MADPILESLCHRLATARRAGGPFDQAWTTALAALPVPPDWRLPLETTRDAWEAAYNRWPDTRRLRAAAAVLADEDRVPLRPAA